MQELKKMGPAMLKRGDAKSMYFPIGISNTKERAYEEARLLRRLGYAAKVLIHTNAFEDSKFVLMVSHQYLYNPSGK